MKGFVKRRLPVLIENPRALAASFRKIHHRSVWNLELFLLCTFFDLLLLLATSSTSSTMSFYTIYQKHNFLIDQHIFYKIKATKNIFFYLKNLVTSHSIVLICANCAIVTVVNNKNSEISQCSEAFPGWNSKYINQSIKQPEWFNEAWCQIYILPEGSSSSHPCLHHLLTPEALFLSWFFHISFVDKWEW